MNTQEFRDIGAIDQRSIIAETFKGMFAATDLRKLDKAQRFAAYNKSLHDMESATEYIGGCLLNSEVTAETVPVPAADNMAEVRRLLGIQEHAAVDAGQVRAIVADAMKSYFAPVVVHVKRSDDAGKESTADLGLQHKAFPDLLQAVQARDNAGLLLNFWLNGEAGTGKTTAAKNLAKALDVPFYMNGAVDNGYKLIGFTDANGNIIDTQFKKAWTNGGVYLFDEVDGSMPNAVLEFNGALANGACPFPEGLLPRHKDCYILAGGNTAGGANSTYNGRMKQDGAFFDRFIYIEWDIDEALETATCSNREWVKRVQGIRAAVKKRGVKNHLVTPRATYNGAALLAQGLSIEFVERATLKKNLSDDVWQQIVSGV